MLQKLKQLVRRAFERRGYEIRRVPARLLRQPTRRLAPTLGMVAAHRLLRHPDLFLVQIGAYDGVAGDDLRDLIRLQRLRGILVEPQPDACARLRGLYQDQPQIRVENVAIADRDGELPFYTVDTAGPGLPAWTGQLASFERDVILRHRTHIPDIERRLITRQIRCVTLQTLLASCGESRVDLLQIDTEGYDAQIIRSIDFSRIKPAIVRYEHKHLSAHDRDDVMRLLLEQGYQLAPEWEDTIAYLME